MNPKLRTILAVVVGILVGAVVIFAVELFSPHQPPADLDINDKVKFAEWVKALPTSAFFILLLAYFLGSAVGGLVTNLVAGPMRYRPALVTGLGLFVAGLMNLMAVPHPWWFVVASSLTYFLGAWIGGRLVGMGAKTNARR
jgi:MFS family permease